MSTRGLTFLIFGAWLAAVMLLIVGIMGIASRPAHSADMNDCKVYATRGSAAALKALLAFPFIDVAAGKFLFRKAYSFCINSDELPEMTFTAEEQPIVDGRITPLPPMKPEGVVPATDPADPVPVVEPAEPKPRGKALCIKHGKRTVYKGRHWRCVK
jgi:hypothetical protein